MFFKITFPLIDKVAGVQLMFAPCIGDLSWGFTGGLIKTKFSLGCSTWKCSEECVVEDSFKPWLRKLLETSSWCPRQVPPSRSKVESLSKVFISPRSGKIGSKLPRSNPEKSTKFGCFLKLDQFCFLSQIYHFFVRCV